MHKRTEFIERREKLKDLDRSFDLAFWQSQTPQARFEAAWELIVHTIGAHAVIQYAEPRYTTSGIGLPVRT
jgi:hypothetical protein